MPYVDVRTIGRTQGIFATSIELLLSSYTPMLIAARPGIRNASIPLTYRAAPSAIATYSASVLDSDALLRPRDPRHQRTPAANSHNRNGTSVLRLMGVVRVYVRL